MTEELTAVGGQLAKDYHAKLDALESLLAVSDAVIEMPVDHDFSPGIYRRTCHIPAGTFGTSKIHKVEHFFILTKGRCRIHRPEGGYDEIVAPHSGVTKAGTRRVVFAVEESVWVSFHPNPSDTEDLDQLEEELIEPRPLPGGGSHHETYLGTLRRKKIEAGGE